MARCSRFCQMRSRDLRVRSGCCAPGRRCQLRHCIPKNELLEVPNSHSYAPGRATTTQLRPFCLARRSARCARASAVAKESVSGTGVAPMEMRSALASPSTVGALSAALTRNCSATVMAMVPESAGSQARNSSSPQRIVYVDLGPGYALQSASSPPLDRASREKNGALLHPCRACIRSRANG